MTEPFPSEADIARRANDLYRGAMERSAPVATAARGRPAQVGAYAYPLLEGRPSLQSVIDSPSYYFLQRGGGPIPPPAAVGLAGGALQAARSDFPALHQQVNGRPLVWLDNAATTQKPQVVIDALTHYYEHDNSNVHRGAHTLAARATDAYEGARKSVARLLGAPSAECVVFVRGTTEGINLLANTLGRQRVGPGDDIVVTTLEHHANIVPWQMLAKDVGARLRPVPVDDSGQVLLDRYAEMLTPRTKVVAVSHVSNALGTILPVQSMIALAHERGIPVVVDGAQAVAHMPVDVVTLGADFYVLSGHKLFGPTGIGAVYGRRDLLESLPPWQGGGSMIRDVTFERTTYNVSPHVFEAGTPSIGDAVGLGAAISYVLGFGMARIAEHEDRLGHVLTQVLNEIPGVHLVGTATSKVAVASFVVDGMPTERVGAALDQHGIAVRAGHHCAQPALRRFGLEATVRASLALYNTEAEIHVLGTALRTLTSGGRSSGLGRSV